MTLFAARGRRNHCDLKLLLIESAPGNATDIGAHLMADGHEVVTCADEHGGPCRGTAQQSACPLERDRKSVV